MASTSDMQVRSHCRSAAMSGWLPLDCPQFCQACQALSKLLFWGPKTKFEKRQNHPKMNIKDLYTMWKTQII